MTGWVVKWGERRRDRRRYQPKGTGRGENTSPPIQRSVSRPREQAADPCAFAPSAPPQHVGRQPHAHFAIHVDLEYLRERRFHDTLQPRVYVLCLPEQVLLI